MRTKLLFAGCPNRLSIWWQKRSRSLGRNSCWFRKRCRMGACGINSGQNSTAANATKERKPKLSILRQKNKKKERLHHHSLCLGFLQLNPLASEAKKGDGGVERKKKGKKKPPAASCATIRMKWGPIKEHISFIPGNFPNP